MPDSSYIPHTLNPDPYLNYGKCEVSYDRAIENSCGANKMQLCPNYIKIPLVDERYLDSHSIYDKCKCLEKMKSSYEIMAKNEPAKYNAYFEIYKNKFSQNKCDDVFKNYIQNNVKDIYSSITQEDKARIEAESKKERNQRIYIGVAVFVVAIGMVSIYSTRNS